MDSHAASHISPGPGVSVRPLRLFGDPVLRTACDPVVRFDDALTRLVTDLLDTVAEPGRAGLAANQIGAGLAVFSYNVDGELGYVINPRVVELSGTLDGPEACLSIPGVSAVRSRADHAVVSGVDLRQDPVVVTGTGELARCLQHEADHLRGKLYIDDLTGPERGASCAPHRACVVGSHHPEGGAPWANDAARANCPRRRHGGRSTHR